MDKSLELQLNGVVDDIDLDTPIDFDQIEENSKNLIITFSKLRIPSSSNSKFSSTKVCFITSVVDQKPNANNYQFSCLNIFLRMEFEKRRSILPESLFKLQLLKKVNKYLHFSTKMNFVYVYSTIKN